MKNHDHIHLTLLALIAMMWMPSHAWAEAEDRWEILKDAFFAGKTVENAPELIRLEAPKRAESGAQVPLSFSIEQPLTAEHYYKNVYILVGVNPVPLSGIFHFTPASGKAEISTRIRLERDSYIHVVAEDNHGKLYMNAVPVRAAGGCGGTVEGDEKAIRAEAGKMKLSVNAPVSLGGINRGKLLIRHPMYTGLQRDLVSQGFRPAFFANKATIKYHGKTVLDADLFIGMSEDPNIQFNFLADTPGEMEVEVHDNEGGVFKNSIQVNG
ncbi:MAG TPA: quinoprotein dehydrogenase-associated SoxYZ-like carrier [Methylophilaceae bacterium]|nr:quinoprotein dehydrogenase-associated SoxYZ-like carrier [Methylophilaceae bacterium]